MPRKLKRRSINQDLKVALPSDYEKRAMVLKNEFMKLPGTFKERIAGLHELTGLSERAIYIQAQRREWKKEMMAMEDRNATAAEMAGVDKFMPDAPTDISFSAIQGNIKDFSFLMVHSTKQICEVASKMIIYYTGRLKKLMLDVGDNAERLSSIQQMKMEMYETKLNKYQNMISEYIKPSNVAKYLELIGMQEALGAIPDEMEMGLLTPQKLLVALAEVGFTNIVGNLMLTDEIKRQILEEGVDLPEIDARKVVDLVNNINVIEREKKMIGMSEVEKLKFNLEGI